MKTYIRAVLLNQNGELAPRLETDKRSETTFLFLNQYNRNEWNEDAKKELLAKKLPRTYVHPNMTRIRWSYVIDWCNANISKL